MKTIVIPDIHQKTHLVDEIFKSEKTYDEVIFLGDWFDSFQAPPHVSSFLETCKYLKSMILENPKREKFKFLIGNHDMSYIYYNNGKSNERLPHIDGYFCSGFTEEKAREFRSEFYDIGLADDFFIKNFKLAHQTQGFTLSHAGIHPSYVEAEESIQSLVNNILPEIWKNFRNLDYPRNSILSGAGYARHGYVPIGGLIWLDWRLEFNTDQRIGPQIVGHTHMAEPSVKFLNSPLESWNIDTESDYGIILNGRFSTKLVKKRKKQLATRTRNITPSYNNWEEFVNLLSKAPEEKKKI